MPAWHPRIRDLALLERRLGRTAEMLLDRTGGRREYCVGVGTDQSDRTDDNDKYHSQHHGVFRDILAFIVCPEFRNEIGHGNPSKLFYFHGWMQRVSLIR